MISAAKMPGGLFLTLLGLLAVTTTSQPFDIDIQDNCSPNTKVLDLDRYSHDLKIRPTISKAYPIGSYFEIKNDKLYTKTVVDLDSMCSTIGECCNKDVEFCHQKISIAILSSSNQHQKKDFRIILRDVNDHSPRFPNTSMEIALSEGTNQPYSISLPLAEDEDFGMNRVQEYLVVSKEPSSFDDFFSLSVHKDGQSPPTDVSMRLNRLLDRETIARFSFELLAFDGDSTSRKTGSISITIRITDENDNRPIFQSPSYKATIEEGRFQEQPILTLTASDLDEGDNAKIVFRLSTQSLNNPSVTTNFRVKEDGKVYLLRALDYEKGMSHQFTVVATNPKPFSINRLPTSTATVEILVKNVHDEPLKVVIDYPDANNWSTVVENKHNEHVAFVIVKSGELGQRQLTVSCRLRDFGSLLELVERPSDEPKMRNFEVKTLAGIDREVHSRIRTSIICVDVAAGPGHQSEAPLDIVVQDENDNDPELSVDGKLQVKENERVGNVVFVVRVKDPDEGDNGMVSFSMDKSSPTSLDYLAIGQKDGKVRVVKNIDCEGVSEPLTSLDVTVTATDHGRPPRSKDLRLKVQVLDVNDNPPYIFGEPLKFQINENSPKHALIGEIEVQDRDHSDKVTLQIVNREGRFLPFIITTKDNKRFLLNSTQSFDCEKDDKFVFSVIVADGSSPKSHSLTSSVEVFINDLNDNAPTIIFPTQNNATFHRISFLEPPFHKLLLVSANDQDRRPENNRLQYSVDDDSKIFTINTEDKFIVTGREMTKKDLGDHRVRVVVRDSGNPSLETSVSINIVVDQSAPKSLSSASNPKSNPGDGERSSVSLLGGIPDVILYVTVIIILFVVIITIVVIIYILRRCQREGNCLYQSFFICCKSSHPQLIVSKSMISSPTPKVDSNDKHQFYSNPHQSPQMNNEPFLDENAFADSYIPENVQVPSQTIFKNPYLGTRMPYAKFCGPHQNLPGNMHIYQTIEDGRLQQWQGDLTMRPVPPQLSRGMTGGQYQSELNIHRYNQLEGDYFPPSNSQRAPWMTSQTPLLSRSPNVVNNILSSDSNENFAVQHPVEESTFV